MLKEQHIMPQSREIQEPTIIHKWRKLGTVVNLPRSGWPTKITLRAQ